MDIFFNAVIILFGQCKKITSPIFSLLEPEEPCGTMQSTNFKHAELAELKDQKIRTSTQSILSINIKFSPQVIRLILSYSNEQSCLDIGIRNRSRCQSLLGNYSSGWHAQANSLQLCCPCKKKRLIFRTKTIYLKILKDKNQLQASQPNHDSPFSYF